MVQKNLLETENPIAQKHPYWSSKPWLILATLFATISFLALWWGRYPSHDAFQLLQTTRRFDWFTFVGSSQPLYLALLSLLAFADAPVTAIAMTTVGWWLTIYAFWQLVQPTAPFKRKDVAWLIGVVTAVLLAIHPAQFGSVGAGHSWTTAVSLFLLLVLTQTSHNQKFSSEGAKEQSLLLTLLLFGFWLHWTTAVFLFLLLAYRYRATSSLPLPTTAVFLLGSTAAGWLAWQNGLSLNLETAFTALLTTIQQTFYESDLYWFTLPLLLIGLWQGRQEPRLGIWLLWWGLLLVLASPLSKPVGAVAFVWLLALAWKQLTDWLQNQQTYAADARLPLFLIAISGLLVATAFAASLAFRQQLRPFSQFAAEDEAIAYLKTAVLSQNSFAASARLAYLLDAPTIIWQDGNQTGENVLALTAVPPDILILPAARWAHELQNSVWVQDNYRPLHTISHHAATLTLLQKVPQPTDSVVPRPVPTFTNFGLNLESVQIAPRSISPGDTVQMRLNWRATAEVHPFGTVLNLTSPIDGTPYAQIDIITPNNLSNPWLTVGQLLPAIYEFTTVPDIPVGAYPITLILHQPHSLDPEPITHPDDSNVLDRRVLDYVAVPWAGEMSGAIIGAAFDDGILLQQAQVEGELMTGGTVQVTLFWGATATPTQNYTIFVHVLDEAGQFVTGADGVAFNGRYPTRGWHPGDTIPSQHTLTLPADLPASSYHIKVGLYLPSNGERLTATNAAGKQPPDKAILIMP